MSFHPVFRFEPSSSELTLRPSAAAEIFLKQGSVSGGQVKRADVVRAEARARAWSKYADNSEQAKEREGGDTTTTPQMLNKDALASYARLYDARDQESRTYVIRVQAGDRRERRRTRQQRGLQQCGSRAGSSASWGGPGAAAHTGGIRAGGEVERKPGRTRLVCAGLGPGAAVERGLRAALRCYSAQLQHSFNQLAQEFKGKTEHLYDWLPCNVVLGQGAGAAQPPKASRLVEAIMLELCRVHRHEGKTLAGVRINRWGAVMRDYKQIQDNVVN
ncbi:hypothetical protein AALO_G00118210 [Alosa alosa]|uniref:Uncharacterized protein n=1 Tax=Alosa alosa TaxID=278164 RepID=A0AAV6GQL8_9TELE|nr:hypothetical protein AALO_G00118210 [Alosa alosa]